MHDWQAVWRFGVAPELSGGELLSLRQALACDHPEVAQRYAALPLASKLLPVYKACPLGYMGWRGAGLRTVGEVERYVALLWSAADANLDACRKAGRLDAPACAVDLIAFIDEAPREEMRRELLKEVCLELARRDE